MIKKTSVHLVLIVMALVTFSMAACAPGSGELTLPVEQAAGLSDSQALATVPQGEGEGAMAAQVENAASDSMAQEEAGQVGIVEVTPLSDEALASTSPGETQPGVVTSSNPNQTEPGAPENTDQSQTDPGTVQTAPLPGDWSTHNEIQFGYSVNYPANFVVGYPAAALLTPLVPSPNASVYYVNPNTAESALAGTDAPDLEVRIFETGAIQSLEGWLATVGAVVPGDGKTLAPYQSAGTSGLEVCESTMVAPGCSVFIAANNRVYQLRYLTTAGERMAGSFNPLNQ